MAISMSTENISLFNAPTQAGVETGGRSREGFGGRGLLRTEVAEVGGGGWRRGVAELALT